jgi:formate-dependent nitrite reductase membrane component NrfD
MQSDHVEQNRPSQETMQFITTDEGMLLAAVFLLASVAGVSRAMRDDDYAYAGQLASIALFSGFVGVGTVAVLRHVGGMDNTSNGLCLGIACIVGLMGKEQDKLIRGMFQWLLKRFGIDKIE